jgi:hypothetical protein
MNLRNLAWDSGIDDFFLSHGNYYRSYKNVHLALVPWDGVKFLGLDYKNNVSKVLPCSVHIPLHN